MLSATTARYWAEQCYKLAMYHGKYTMSNVTQGIACVYQPDKGTVMVSKGTATREVRVAKSWLYNA